MVGAQNTPNNTQDLQSYLWSGKDSALAKWFHRGADGARLDVASEIGLELLASITRSAHRHKKGSLVVGEVWASLGWKKPTKNANYI